MYSCGYNFRLPLRGVGPTGRRLDLGKNISFLDGLLVKQHTVNNLFAQTKDGYPLSAESKVTIYLNEMTKADLMGLKRIGKTLSDHIISNKPFRTKRQLQEKVHIAEGRWNQMQSTPGKSVRIYRA